MNQSEYINQTIVLSVITVRGIHCTIDKEQLELLKKIDTRFMRGVEWVNLGVQGA
jgi:hypothetical protein